METEQHIPLTSAELSSLWTNYLADSMAICIFQYFRAKLTDTEIKPILENALKLSEEHIEYIQKVFTDEGIPIPIGFSDKDVNLAAPPLFHDTFMLNYIKYMAKGGLVTFAVSLPNMERKDIREFYTGCLTSVAKLYNESTLLLLSKGADTRPPYIPYPKEIEFVKKQSFLGDWFGAQRPLTGQEIMNLYSNIQTNKLGEAIVIAFGQVAKSNEIRNFMLRGKEISKKHIDVFSKYLKGNDLPVPMTWNHDILNETESPFSDKLMMYHISTLNAYGIGNYGLALSMSYRRDITADYARLIAEIGLYAEDGFKILINHGWLENPPHAVDRNYLIKNGHH